MTPQVAVAAMSVVAHVVDLPMILVAGAELFFRIMSRDRFDNVPVWGKGYIQQVTL